MRRRKTAAQKQPCPSMRHEANGHDHAVRTTHYKGFKIEVETHYQFRIDGKPLDVHAHVLDSGHLHSPSLPNYGWPSALDFVRQLIDSFPDDFQPEKKSSASKTASSPASKKKAAAKSTTSRGKAKAKKKSKAKRSGR